MPVPVLRLLVGADSAPSAPVSAHAISLDAAYQDMKEDVPVCELLVESALAGIFDPSRRFLAVSGPSLKLSDQPEYVHALVCSTRASGGEPSCVALLAPSSGPAFVLPRAGAPSASQIRVRLAEKNSTARNLVAVAQGTDPYTTLLDAVKVIAQTTGAAEADVREYVLPLLDGVNRMRYDAALAVTKSSCAKGTAADATTMPAYEQLLHENILVQAGPDCPAKPLLQAPGLRVCQGMSAPLGLRYSGLSVVYGTATGHVLAVMDTAAALRMAPASGMRASGAGGKIASHGSGGYGSDSPSAVSAGVSDTTSATPSPPMSRANSCGGDFQALDAAATAAAATSIASLAPADASAAGTPQTRAPLVRALSGRSITAAPVIQVLAAAGNGVSAVPLRPLTPTGAPAQVLASFALVGIKSVGGRDGHVRCCRIMPSSTLRSAAAADGSLQRSADCLPAGGLGLVVQLEVFSSAAGSLLMFVEGPEEAHVADGGLGDLEDVQAVRGVSIDGRPARWRYDSAGGMLKVDLPAAAPAQAQPVTPLAVQVFL